MSRMVTTRPKASQIAGRLAGALLALCAIAVQADDGGLYMGIGASLDSQQFSYGKTVFTPESRAAGTFTSAESAADHLLPTLAAFAGYRLPLPLSRLHLSVEVDGAAHPSKLNGHLEGTGYTWLDTWPEDWWLKRKSSYGLSVKLGGLLGPSPIDLYALAGLRSVAAEFSITETGCPGPELLCPPTPLASFTETVERTLRAWTVGVGLERQLSERYAAQLEVRRTDFRRKSWDRLFEGGVVIPSTVEGDEIEAALRIVRRF